MTTKGKPTIADLYRAWRDAADAAAARRDDDEEDGYNRLQDQFAELAEQMADAPALCPADAWHKRLVLEYYLSADILHGASLDCRLFRSMLDDATGRLQT